LSSADDILDVDGYWKRELEDDLRELLTIAESQRPRNLQRALGPSEVGHMCKPRLARGLVSARQPLLGGGINTKSDPLASIMGTAMHGVAEQGAILKNEALKAQGEKTRWIPETKVTVREGLTGTADLYDLLYQAVIDWKFPGTTAFKKYSTHGPSDIYRGQAHMYGRGYKNLGFPVKYVGNMYVCRSGTMRMTKLWIEPYSDEVVDEILAKLDRVEMLIDEYGCERDPEGFLRIPISPGDDCHFCNFYSPVPEGPWQCGGKDEKRVPHE
jgi:hypothetical protein